MDALRGFAILGILVMNIQSFSMIEAAYLNPTAYGDLTGLNRWVWILSHLLAEQKFMTLFSLLFGAGIVLFTGRIEARGLPSLGLFYRRTGWLLVFGLLHAYLLWHGDILVTYALCGLAVVFCRKWSPGRLFVTGGLTFAVASLLYLFFGFSLPQMPAEGYEGIKVAWQSSPEITAREVAAYRGGWLEQMPLRAEAAFRFQVPIFLMFHFWRVSGLMLLGMALFKGGVFTGERSGTFYRGLALVGLGLGLPVVGYGLAQNFAAGWTVDYSMFLGAQYNYWASLAVSLGYCGLVILVTRAPRFRAVAQGLGAVGRMALTNYLLQTLICTTLFYGHGLGWFGRVERSGQLLIVAGIWAAQLILSPWWLRHYRFGPAEWLWRSLTYGQRLPLRQAPRPAPAVPLASGH